MKQAGRELSLDEILSKVSSGIKSTILLALLCIAGCASLEFDQQRPGLAYITSDTDDAGHHMPVIVVEHPDKPYNRIGKPVIHRLQDRYHLTVDADMPVAYSETRHFVTEQGSYTNYIYRVHFERVPFSLLPFSLTMGKNVGLIFIMTVNDKNQPVLITTVHTCGCYLAFVPTIFTSVDALPDDWAMDAQSVYGATLPGMLAPTSADQVSDDMKVIIYLRSQNHRVINLEMASVAAITARYATEPLVSKPISDLDMLSLPGSHEQLSMFESDGVRKGYVRDAYKPFEFLLMSWWAFDSRVGVDKRYGYPGDQGPVFYTSLKPWARERSDMRDFPRFLQYWGWRL